MNDFIYMPRGLQALKDEMYTCRREQFRRLHEQCRWYEKEVLPQEHPMKSITYFAMAAANLSLAYKLTDQSCYLDEAKRWIFQGVAYPHWGRAVKVDVDLSAAWLLFGFGLCYNWLKKDFSQDEKQLLLNKLILQGTRMYDYACSNKGKCWPTNYWQNHNWIDYTGLAMAGYAIVDEYPEAQNWIDAARKDLVAVFPMLSDDGSDYEGIAYWRYGVIWLAQYAELLREKENVDLFADSHFLKNTFYYRLYQTAPDLEQNFNFGDCHDKRSGHTPALYYKLASEYKNGHAQWLANQVIEKMLWREHYESGIKPGILPEAFLEFLWYDPTIAPVAISSLPAEKFFPDLGLFSLRSDWGRQAQAISYKCSSGGGQKQWQLSTKMEREFGYKIRSMGHHHPDSNSFILINGSDYLVVDEGYNSKKKAEHHNLVIVDGEGYEHEDNFDVYSSLEPERTAKVEDYHSTKEYSYLRGESSALYKKELELTSYKRELLCFRHGYYIICDRLTSTKPHTYTMLLHCETTPTANGNEFLEENGESCLQIHVVPNKVHSSVKTTSVSANPTSQEPSLIIYHHMQTLCTKNIEPQKDFTFLTVLAPRYQFMDPFNIEEYKTSWGYVLKIKGTNFEDYIIYNPEHVKIKESLQLNGKILKIDTDNPWGVL